METPLLYRKRIIPEECIPLNDDIILYHDSKIIVTKWKALHPKRDLHHGFSCYFLEEGYKISKFLCEDDSLLYWYCDIFDFEMGKNNEIIFRDLLADVLVYPDGFVKVVDLDEFEEALGKGAIGIEDVKHALKSLNNLLSLIYASRFDKLTYEIDSRID